MLSGSASCGSSPVAYPDFTPKVIASLCATEVRCGGFASADTCVAELKQIFTTNLQELDDVADGVIDYDAGQAGQCVDDLAALSCTSANILDRGSPSSCVAVLKGTVIDGGACFNSADCISRECDSPGTTPSCSPGSCAKTPMLVAVGGSCSGTNESCGDFAFCDSNSGTCKAFLGAGAACTVSGECANGLACANSVCAPLPTAGQACSSADGCASLGLACFVASGAQTGICAAYADAGASCAAAKCKNDSTCDASTMLCVANGAPMLVVDGASCMSSEQCASTFCNPAGVCAEQTACHGNV